MEQLSKSKINSLRDDLIAFNEAYRKGKPQISDIEYDHLVEVLWENSPQDEFFKRGIVEQPTERMEKLPLPMYSLEKIKTVQAFRKWLEKMSAAGK
jgi:DNA ligase (NAD+)